MKNATAKYFGERVEWAKARLVFYNIHGLWGGEAVYLTGVGLVYVRKVDRQLVESRYCFKVEAEKVEELVAMLIKSDFINCKITDREGVPDEARVEIKLKNSAGEIRRVAKWDNDPQPAFDRAQNALVKIGNQVSRPAAYIGKFQADYAPPEFS